MDPLVLAGRRSQPVFPTPILIWEIADPIFFNQALVAWVQGLRDRDPGVQRTNAGGWHSRKQLADDPQANRFVQIARDALSAWAVQSFALTQPPAPADWHIELWANLNQRGHYNHAHDHFRSGVIASAFYYVQCGGENVGGRTVFLNQQSVPAKIETDVAWRDSEYAVTPKDGTLIVFPSWLGHRVEPYLGDGDRITLALNASHPALPVRKRGDRPLPAWLSRLLGR